MAHSGSNSSLGAILKDLPQPEQLDTNVLKSELTKINFKFGYNPEKIQHREIYLKEIAKILAPALRRERPSNIVIYGKTGTGKSLCTSYVLNKMRNFAIAKDEETMKKFLKKQKI